ncbi:Putative inactive receptor kinase [Glycine soja]|nr:Putative inactive receptor kinase [Glycine soja]
MGELLRASAEALGHGILGNSYKAMLNDGSTIVVKRLRDLKPLSKEEFAKILNVIADMKHPNLLSLLAYYHSRDEKLMLYRYAENGNLFSRLHGVARALVYLQLNHNNIVPHGNLRSSNEDDTVLVSDFGLASLIAQPIAAQHMVVYKSPECLELRFASDRASNWESVCVLSSTREQLQCVALRGDEGSGENTPGTQLDLSR